MRQSPAEARPLCRVITEAGIQPKVRANLNVRVPDLAVTCAAWDPGVMSYCVSRSSWSRSVNLEQGRYRANVWSYFTIPSVREILLPHTADIRADLLRRDEDGVWPDNPLTLTLGDTVTLESIDFTAPIDAFYRTA